MLSWYPLSFQSDGTLAFPDQLDGPDGILTTLLAAPDGFVTDLWVLSYGWNTSVQEGTNFYNEWVGLLRSEIQKVNPENYNPMFVGVFWPSKILADTSSKPDPSRQPIPTSSTPTEDLADRTHFIQAHRPIFDPEQRQDDAVYEQDFGWIYDFITSPDIKNQQHVTTLVDILKKYQQQDPHADQLKPENVIDTNAPTLAEMLTKALTSPFAEAVQNGLLDFLRVFSFWTMKGRAGTIGANGLAPFLGRVQQLMVLSNPPLRIHLMGHSFGAKLITSAVYGTVNIPEVAQPIANTLILFQGAFSQFSFSRNIPDRPGLAGFYVNLVEQELVAAPVVVIYSTRDLANGRLYPIGMAPILEQFVLEFVRDDPSEYQVSNDLRGAIGANGAQGFDTSQMYLVKLPWPGIDQSTLGAVRCINVNRTPFLNSNINDPLIGIHNDYTESEIFRAALDVSLLKVRSI